jgi:hypothetical protein
MFRANGGFSFIHKLKDASRILQQVFAGRREGYIATVAVEEFYFELGLKLLNVLAHRGLCNEQRLASTRKTARFCNRPKYFQLAKTYAHTEISSISDRYIAQI